MWLMAETKTAQIFLRIGPKLKARAIAAAAADHRSLSSLIEKLLADHCNAPGLLTDNKASKARGRKK